MTEDLVDLRIGFNPWISKLCKSCSLCRTDRRGQIGTRPDTRPIPVANGWAGAEMRFFSLFDSITMTNGRTDGSKDGRTDQRTDGRTKPLIELRVRN